MMVKTKPGGSAKKSSSKVVAASKYKNDKISRLLTLAAGAPPLPFEKNKSTAKLFEIVVLTDLITSYLVAKQGTVVVENLKGGANLYFAGSPSQADKTRYSWIRFKDNAGSDVHEGWISVQFATLSWHRDGEKPPVVASDRHEMDVALFEPLGKNFRGFPRYEALHLGVSCKHFPPTKECIREVLGLRRETAYLRSPVTSKAVWMLPEVPAEPPSLVYLASSSFAVQKYAAPIDKLGVYVASVPFR